jgi:hypothetical protein
LFYAIVGGINRNAKGTLAVPRGRLRRLIKIKVRL